MSSEQEQGPQQPARALTAEEREAQQREARAARLAMFARPNPARTTAPAASTTTTTSVAQPTPSAVARPTTTTSPSSTTTTSSQPRAPTTTTSATSTTAPTIRTPTHSTTTTTTPSHSHAQSTDHTAFTPQDITFTPTNSTNFSDSNHNQPQWSHIFDQYLHQVLRHVFRITTDTDILSTTISDARLQSSLSTPSNSSSSIQTAHLPSSLSTHVGQVQPMLKQEQRAGYIYLPLTSRVILGEFVSHGLSRFCSCVSTDDAQQSKSTPRRQQDCKKCRKAQPFLNVSHLESIFGEINSLMTGYQRIPTELIQSKASISEPPSLDECFTVLCNLISNNGLSQDHSDAAAASRTNGTSLGNFDRNTNDILTQLTDSTDTAGFQPLPLPEVAQRNETGDKADHFTVLQQSISYYQQTAMMIGALSAQALTHQLPTTKITNPNNAGLGGNKNLLTSNPLLTRQPSLTPLATALSTSTATTATTSQQQTQPAQQTPTNQLQVVSSLMNRIPISSALALSSPLSTAAHLSFNVHNVTLRSKSLLWFYLQAYERVQTLYEYLSSLTSLNTLSGLNAVDLVSKLNRLIDMEINKHQNAIKMLQNEQEDDKYSRLNTHVQAGVVPHEQTIKALQARRIELQTLNVPAQGQIGDLLHIVRFLSQQKQQIAGESNKMNDIDQSNANLHKIKLPQQPQSQTQDDDLSTLSGQTFKGMDALSRDVNVLLGLDTENVNLSSILSTIAQSQLLTACDFDVSTMSNGTLDDAAQFVENRNSASSVACFGSHPSALVAKNLDQPINVGFNTNTLYSALKHPGMTSQNGIQRESATTSTTSTTGGEVLYTMNSDSSDAYFSSLICPQIQPLTAAIVSTIVPNTHVVPAPSTTGSTPLVEVTNPVPIFSYVHSQIAINGLMNVHTSKGPNQLPMIMLVNLLLSTLSTISHRIFSAVGEMLLSESDLALAIIHEHFKTVSQQMAQKGDVKKPAAAQVAQAGTRQSRVIGADVVAPQAGSAANSMNDNTNESIIEQAKIECLRVLYEKTPSYALFLQSLQSNHIKHQHQGMTFYYDKNMAQSVAGFVQNRLTSNSTPFPQQSSSHAPYYNQTTAVPYTTNTGKRVQLLFPTHPFAKVASQQHEWSQALGIFGAYGIHKHVITNKVAPFSFQSYFSYSITRSLPVLSPITPHSIPSTTQPSHQVLSLAQRFPVATQSKPQHITLNHSVRRKHPNNTYNSYADLSSTQSTILAQFPAIAQYLVNVGDEIETDGVTQVVSPSQNVSIATRSSFTQQLFNQHYRYTHTYGVHTIYAQQYLEAAEQKNTTTATTTTNQQPLLNSSDELTTFGKQTPTTTLVLHGNPIHILPLPTGFIQGLSDVLEGVLPKVSGTNFDIDFIQSIFTINTGVEIKLDHFTFPASKSHGNTIDRQHSGLITHSRQPSGLTKQLSASLNSSGSISQSQNAGGNSASNSSQSNPKPTQSLSINTTLTPTHSQTATFSPSVLSPTTPSQQSLLLKHSPTIAAFLRTYNAYRTTVTTTPLFKERGSVVLASVTYPLISYFFLTLLLADSIRDLLVSKSLIPLDIIDSCSSYENIFANWVVGQNGHVYANSTQLSQDRDFQNKFLKLQNQHQGKAIPQQQQQQQQQRLASKVKLGNQQQIHQSLLTLGIRESALSLALHSFEKDQYDITTLLRSNPLLSSSSSTPSPDLSNQPSRLTFGNFSPGYDASFAPNFILCGLSVLEQLAKKNHGIQVNKTPQTPTHHIGSIGLLSLFSQIASNGQSLTISKLENIEATTPISDVTHFVSDILTTRPQSVPITISQSIQPIYPIFSTIRPTSIAFATVMLRSLVTLTSAPSITAVLLAHPGYAPMYNSLALPQRQISQRVLQWVHLKRVLDLAAMQTAILSPLASMSSQFSNQSGAPFGGLDLGNAQINNSPSVSPQFSSQVGVSDLNDESFAPMLSISSIFSLPGIIRSKLNSIDLPKPNVHFSLDVFSKKPSTQPSSQSSTSNASVGSNSGNFNAKPAQQGGLQAQSPQNSSKSSFTLDKLQQYSGLSFLDAILPFLSNKIQQTTFPTTAYPISITNNSRSPKLFAISSLFGLLYNVYPTDHDPAFLNLKERAYLRVAATFKRLRNCLSLYCHLVDGLNDRILRIDVLTRRRWMDYQTQFALQCVDYRKMAPNTDTLPSAGSLLTWSSMLLTQLQRVIKQPPQPVHLTLQHALSELGFSPQHLGMLSLYHPLSNAAPSQQSTQTQPTYENWAQTLLSQPSQQLLDQFSSTDINSADWYPGKMELTYLLRFDDSPNSFQLKLPPHIYFHVLKHFTPMSVDDFHRNNSNFEPITARGLVQPPLTISEISTQQPQPAQSSSSSSSSSWFGSWGNDSSNASQRNKKSTNAGKDKENKSRLVSLIASSAAGISEMARGFLASNDSDEDDENELSTSQSDGGDRTDGAKTDTTTTPVPSQPPSQQSLSQTQLAQSRNSPTYLSMMYSQISELLQVLSFFTQNSCDCSQHFQPHDLSRLYSPTPCHSGKALQSLASNPWVLPTGTGLNSANAQLDTSSSSLITTNNHGFGGSILHDTNILANIVQQYREEQQFLQESNLFDSFSRDNFCSTLNSHSNTPHPRSSLILSQSMATDQPSVVGMANAARIQPVVVSSSQPAQVNLTQLSQTDDLGLMTRTTLQKIPKNIFKLTDICSQCGLLLKTASASSATSSTLTTLRSLKSKLQQALHPNGSVGENEDLENGDESKAVQNLPILPTDPAQRLETVLEFAYGPQFNAAKQLGLWMLFGNNKREQRSSTHLFNVFLIPSEEEDDETELDDTKGPDLSRIECIEATTNVMEGGQEVECVFSTYFIPVSLVLQSIISDSPTLSHIVNLKTVLEGETVDAATGDDLSRFTDVDPFKLKVTPPSITSSASTMNDSGDTTNDKNPNNVPLVFCHDIKAISELGDNFDMDPEVVCGLIAAFNQTKFDMQQSVFKNALLDLQSGKDFLDSTGSDVSANAASQNAGGGKKHRNGMTDGDDQDDDGDEKRTLYNMQPGSQYIHCGPIPPYPPAPTRYVRYFDLERLFYHSTDRVNDIRQVYANKLFLLCSQKAHELTIIQINSFLNREFQRSKQSHKHRHQNGQKKPMLLSQCDQDQLYDSLYSYNLMFHLSHFFSEHSLIKGLDTTSSSIKNYVELPQSAPGSASTSSTSKPSSKLQLTFDVADQQQALAISNQSLSSSLFGFRTEILCLSIESLHLTIPTLVRAFEQAEENVQAIDERIQEVEAEHNKINQILSEAEPRLQQLTSTPNNGGMDYSSFMRFKSQIEMLRAQERHIQQILQDLKREKLATTGRFGRCKMVLSDPQFIQRILTVYNWVCSFMLACMNSSCIYCRGSGIDDSNETPVASSTDQGDEADAADGEEETPTASASGDKSDETVAADQAAIPQAVNASSDEKILVNILSKTYSCTCARTLVGVIPEYWINDVWQWLNALNRINDSTLRVLSQTNALDSLLLLATSTVSGIGSNTAQFNKANGLIDAQNDDDDLSNLINNPNLFNHVNQVTALVNKANISAGKVNAFTDILSILQANKCPLTSPKNSDNQDLTSASSNSLAPSIDLDLSTLRTLFEVKGELDYEYTDKNEEYIKGNFSSYSFCEKEDAQIRFEFDSELINTSNINTNTSKAYYEQQYSNSLMQTQQYHSKTIVYHSIDDFSIIAERNNLSPRGRAPANVEIRYINRYSPLYILLAAQVTKCIPQHVYQQLNKTSDLNTVYPVIEATLLKLYAQKFSNSQQSSIPLLFPPSMQSITQYFQSNFIGYLGQIAVLSHTQSSHIAPNSILRAPLQLYLISVLRSFLPYSERANATKDAQIMDEHIKENQNLVNQAQVSWNAISLAKKVLAQWPYNQQTTSSSMNDGQKAVGVRLAPHPPNHPTDFFTALLLSQSDQRIPINHSTHKTQPQNLPNPLHDVTAYSQIKSILTTSSTSINPNTTLYSTPSLPTEPFSSYNRRKMRQLAKDQDGFISPSGISWWPMQYQNLDSSTHPLWRTGKQSSELMSLLLHLYASTATTDNVEVTNEQDRRIVWEASREKHTNKGYLMDLFASILLTEEEDENTAKQSQSNQIVFSDITLSNRSGATAVAASATSGSTTTDTTLSNDYTYITQCNHAILQYEQWRQTAVRKSMICNLYDELKASVGQTDMGVDSDLTLHKSTMRKVAELITSPNPNVHNHTPSLSNYGHSYLLPQITRLPNGHCYCGCSCFGCGCGFDYYSYNNIQTDESLRAIHIPPPFTTCICGQHTKSLTKLAIPTALTAALTTKPHSSSSVPSAPPSAAGQLHQGNLYVNPSDISSITHPLSSQFTTKVQLHTILVDQYNSSLEDAQTALSAQPSMSDEDPHGAILSKPHLAPKPLELQPIHIQFPLFDRFIHVLCNDVSSYMEDTLKLLAQMKERETAGIKVTEEDVRRYDEEQERQARNPGREGVIGGQNDPNAADGEQAPQTTRPITDRELLQQAYWNTHFANRSLLLLSVICSRGKLALLRPEFATRIAVIIGGYLHKLTNPQQMRQFNINAELRKHIKFSPKDLILLLVYILSSLAMVPSGINIHDLSTLTFQLHHPLHSIKHVLKLLPGSILSQHFTPSSTSQESFLDQSSDVPILGGLTMLRSLVHKDAKFSSTDFQGAINVLLKTGSASTSTPLEQAIIDQPLAVVLHTIKTDAAKHGANYASQKQYIATGQGQNASDSADQTGAARLVVYGANHDDRSRAIARCQSRAIGVLQLYSNLNALKGHNDGSQTMKTMLNNQNTCSSVRNWSWLYSNPTALTYAHLLHEYGLTKTQTATVAGTKTKNRYVEEIGFAWWPLPPLTSPIYISLLNALKGEHEWDEFLTVRHFCPNTSTIASLRLNDQTAIQNHLNTTILPQLFVTPEWIETNYTQKNLSLPSFTYYSRSHSLTSEFWLKRLLSLFDIYNAQLSRDERLLGTAVDDFMNTPTSNAAPVNLFDFGNDDDDSDLEGLEEGEPDDLDLPAEFTDDLFLDIMDQPIKLSKSGAKIEWLSLYRSLLNVKEDPYTRQSLEVNDILPLPHIQYAIRLYKLRRGVL